MLAITIGIAMTRAASQMERTNQSVSRLIMASITATSLPDVDTDQSLAARERLPADATASLEVINIHDAR